MDNEKFTSQEILVLSDDQGNLYAIPRDAVEKYRAEGEKKSNLAAILGEDVRGFEIGNYFAMQDTSNPYQSSRLVDAERDRQAHIGNAGIGHDENTASGIPISTPESRWRSRTFIGRFITMLTPQQKQIAPT